MLSYFLKILWFTKHLSYFLLLRPTLAHHSLGCNRNFSNKGLHTVDHGLPHDNTYPVVKRGDARPKESGQRSRKMGIVKEPYFYFLARFNFLQDDCYCWVPTHTILVVNQSMCSQLLKRPCFLVFWYPKSCKFLCCCFNACGALQNCQVTDYHPNLKA